MEPDEILRWLVFGLPLTGLVSQVPAHAQQQQHVHGEQVEGEQQRRALAGAEGHSQHPHPPRAAASGLQEGERERRAARLEATRLIVVMTPTNAAPRRSLTRVTAPSDGSMKTAVSECSSSCAERHLAWL